MKTKDEVIFEKVEYKQLLYNYEVLNLKTKKKRANFDENSAWHWHNEMEICYVRGGKAVYKIASNEYTVEKGDFVFVNPNVIHAVLPSYESEQLFITVHLFEDSFISGGVGTAIDIKYIAPVVNNTNIEIVIIKADDKRAVEIGKLMEENAVLKLKKPDFWEFDLKTNAFKIWKILFNSVDKNYDNLPMPEVPYRRLKQALSYIQVHYAEKITLEDIASEVHISTRECNRMFRKYLNMSPISYMLSVRLSHAVRMLCNTEKTVFEIAVENGYSCSSQFSKHFRDCYDITPSEYRKAAKKEGRIKL